MAELKGHVVKCCVCGKGLGDFLDPEHPDALSTECKSCREVDNIRRDGSSDSKWRHEQEFLENEDVMRTGSLTVCSSCEKTESKCTCEYYSPRTTIDDRTVQDEEDYEEDYEDDY